MSVLFERAICLEVHKTKYEVSKTARVHKVEGDSTESAQQAVTSGALLTDANVKRVRGSKKILLNETLDAIIKLDREARLYLVDKALPSQFASGCYLIPCAYVEVVEEYCKVWKVEREDLVKQFKTEYQDAVDASKNELGSLYNPSDYVSPTEAAEDFTLEWAWKAYSTPDTLKGISAELFKEEQEKAARHWSNALDEIKNGLRTGLLDVTAKLAEVLTPDPLGGKKKKLYDVHVDSIKKYLEVFDCKNISDDEDLKQIVQDARDLLDGVTVDELRKDETFSEAVKGALDSINQQLSGLVDTSVRRFNADASDEEPPAEESAA